MSAAFYVELTAIKEREAERDKLIAQLQSDLAAAQQSLESLTAERRSLQKEVRELSGKVETLHAMKAAIEKDARDILGAKRDRIDPTKVKMPQTLRSLGYGKEKP